VWEELRTVINLWPTDPVSALAELVSWVSKSADRKERQITNTYLEKVWKKIVGDSDDNDLDFLKIAVLIAVVG
jgi:hypothetical protein